ncbi:nucleoside triphosphate pyrophosphohydrolase [Aggregicoccus sp. 17bor-14]|uniref:nucleoside triphosphate pyrophosphohydrolase n=1 Tax=Myxococcaceae TaxID=31 RepID=UPI00129D20D0|nr:MULTISPECIES: nucleoside triphosphate pyrophosphohydrolase [Myxococcaceae]MBF5046343.1 nucleoside triphosphate pyrophosphohydrolase [Simulacricoccus sp. 17bor-14]MRI92063.1 nucleoside triphosphate pyrophosphohydrolase [Aggregicoccus sp. 17bor-14]
MSSPGTELERLIAIMARLRAPDGCPWDREQDLRSLRPYLVEECFEVVDEMDRAGYAGPWRALGEELGDLLFQIVFHAQLAAERGEFTMADVCRSISDKLERRHPHVFGEGAKGAPGAEQVLANWAKLKAEERKHKTGSEGSVLDGVPVAAPALLRAERLTEKASRIGFDWPDTAGVRAKLDEELRELDEAIASGDRDALEHELGDVLFSVANLARFIRTPAEDALRMAIGRFTTRFHHVEAGLRADGAAFGEATLEQMDRHWLAAKQVEKSLPPVRSQGRAALALVRLPVPALAPQRAFWDALAPLLGWSALPAPGGEARYGDAALAFAFFEGAAGAGAPALELHAPSKGAVEALRRALAERHPQALREGDAAAGRLSFVDPAGLSWRYGA